MIGTRLPSTTVVPSRFERNGSVCATCCAYSGAASDAATITTSTPSIAIAIQFLNSLRRAIAQGLAPLGSVPTTAGTSPARVLLIASRSSFGPDTSPARRRGLLDPRLGHEPVELLAEREVADAFRHEVDVLRVEERRHRRLIRHHPVDLRPELVRGRLVGDRTVQSGVHLCVDLLVAEAGHVDAGVASRVEGLAAEQDVEEVRGGRVVLVPLLHVDLDLVLRVLRIGERDVGRDRLD